MRKITLIAAFFLISAVAFAGNKETNQKSKIIANVDFREGEYVLISPKYKDHTILPSILPEEFQKEGLEVVVEGYFGKCKHKQVTFEVTAIAVNKDTYEKLGLKNIEYNYFLYALAASAF